MAIREVDAIENAIIETEREIALEAWGQEENTELDETGDRSPESMGEGLEGQHEPDEDETEGEEADGESETGEGEGETAEAEVAAAATAAAAEAGKGKTATEPPKGQVPSGTYRQVAERARAAEAERDALKAQIEKAKGDTTSLADRLDAVTREIAELKRAPREVPKAAEPPAPAKRPDQFEDPDGFADFLERQAEAKIAPIIQQLANQRVETSMAIAHAIHKDTFAEAFAAVNKLDPQNPDDRVTVQRIYASPNPGEALVGWHKRSKTLAEVGDDPTAFRERVAKETRDALMKDPEFRKQLAAEMRGEAAQPGPDGKPRNLTRLPNSLHRAPGSNLGAEHSDPNAGDDSDQAIAASAWR
jgi:hypothetical protein